MPTSWFDNLNWPKSNIQWPLLLLQEKLKVHCVLVYAVNMVKVWGINLCACNVLHLCLYELLLVTKAKLVEEETEFFCPAWLQVWGRCSKMFACGMQFNNKTASGSWDVVTRKRLPRLTLMLLASEPENPVSYLSWADKDLKADLQECLQKSHVAR